MPEGKKILIVSCSTGSGHFRAAEALRLTCERLYPDSQIAHLDMANHLDGIAYIYVVSFYSFFSKLIPLSYKIVYHVTDHWFVQKLFKILAPIMAIGSRKFIKQIDDYRADLIISTHYLPQFILPKKNTAPFAAVVTDYYAHKIWLSPRNKNLFVPTEEVKNDLAKIGINSVASGIPIHPSFFEEKNTRELRTKFNIHNNWPIILLMPISSGNIKPEQAVRHIFSHNFNRPLNIIAISGKNNEKTFNKLSELKPGGQHNFILLKNVENVDELMRIADVIISKAGGLTISEALFLQKPIIIINPIPGQEDYNTAYLEKNQYGMQAHSSDDLVSKIELILSKPDMIHKKSYPDPSKIILEYIFKN